MSQKTSLPNCRRMTAEQYTPDIMTGLNKNVQVDWMKHGEDLRRWQSTFIQGYYRRSEVHTKPHTSVGRVQIALRLVHRGPVYVSIFFL